MKRYLYEKDPVTQEEYAIKNPQWEKRAGRQNYKLMLEWSGIPKNYWDLEFKDYKGEISQKELAIAEAFAKNIRHEKVKNTNLYIWGPNSGQKTMIACAIGKEAIRQGLYVQFILAGDLIDSLMKNQGYNKDEEESERLKKLRMSSLVIVDDVFDDKKSLRWKTTNADLIISEVDRFIRTMTSENNRLVFTSNIELETIKHSYGQSIYELMDREFLILKFEDIIKKHRKDRYNEVTEFLLESQNSVE